MTASAGGRKAAPLIDVIIGSPRWRRTPKAASIVRRAIRTAAKSCSTPHAELAILLTNDSAVRAYNRQWRKRDVPTNVLSFPAKSIRHGRGASRRLRNYLGDIVIAFETTAREAANEKKSFGHHLAHLAVHGYLHLLGYDHATDRQAKTMERLETRILARLNVPAPYLTRDHAL